MRGLEHETAKHVMSNLRKNFSQTKLYGMFLVKTLRKNIWDGFLVGSVCRQVRAYN